MTTTNTTNDSIGALTRTEGGEHAYEDVDALALVNKSNLASRNFTTNDSTKTYTASENLGTTGSGSFLIQGATSTSGDVVQYSTIDLGDNTGFEMSNASTLTFKDVKVTGENTLVTVSANNAVVNTNNAYIDGDITGGVGTVNINTAATDKTTFSGDVSVDTINLNHGTLKLTSTADISGTDKFVVNGCTLDVKDGATVEYGINDLTLNSDLNYVFDVNLASALSDKLVLNSTGSVVSNNNNIIVDYINLYTGTSRRVTRVTIADTNLAGLFTPNGGDWLSISKYSDGSDYVGNVTYDNVTGVLKFEMILGDRTLDRIATASETYLNSVHAVTALSTDSTGMSQSVYIDGVKYYYNSDNQTLVNLVNTGDKALRVLDNSTGAVFSYNNGTTTVYYGYDADELPISAWTRTEVASTGDWNYSVILSDNEGSLTTKYYRIEVPTSRLGQSSKISYSEGTSSDYDFKVTLPSQGSWTTPDVRYYKYTAEGYDPENWGDSSKFTYTEVLNPASENDYDFFVNVYHNGVLSKKYYAVSYSGSATPQTAQITDIMTIDNTPIVFNEQTLTSTSGGAIFNTGNYSNVDIVADFVKNIQTITSSSASYISGGMIGNYGYGSTANIGDITGDFVGNYVSSSSSASYVDGGIIVNYTLSGTASISSITGDFVGNYVSSSSSSSYVDGGMIGNYAIDTNATVNIGSITGDFVGNYVSSSSAASYVYGGMIGNYAIDTNATVNIGSITGDFVGNYVSSSSSSYSSIYGGMIGNYAFNSGATVQIDSITGDFVGNYVSSSSSSLASYVYGGMIGNYAYIPSGTATASIGNITGDFVGNYVSSSSSSSDVYGGMIFNSGTNASIGSITGDFVGNYVKASSSIQGGMIYNYYGTIDSITGDFVGNYVKASSSIQGGMIYNSGTMGSITGDFVGNYVYSGTYTHGGMIYNSGTMGNITGDFVGNYVYSGTYTHGWMIYNSGTMGNITGDFVGNYVSSSSYIQGGMIDNNNTNSSIGSITSDFVGNYVSSSSYVLGMIHSSGSIESITGDFVGNYVSSSSYIYCGMIYNTKGTIDSITGDFVGNYVSSSSSFIYGGMIDNLKYSTIGSITGNFVGNYVSSSSHTQGGMIRNEASTDSSSSVATSRIGDITGEFSGNYVYSSGNYVDGGLIYNYGNYSNIATIGALDGSGNVVGGIVNSSFYNNIAITGVNNASYVRGAVLWTNRDVNFIADDYTSTFSGNYVQYGGASGTKVSEAIYVERGGTSGSYTYPTIKFQTSNGGKFVIADGINGVASDTTANADRYTVRFEGGQSDILMNSFVKNANIELSQENVLDGSALGLSNSVLNLQNNTLGTLALSSLTVSGNSYYGIDVNLETPTADIITVANTISAGAGSIIINSLYLMTDGDDYVEVQLTNNPNLMSVYVLSDDIMSNIFRAAGVTSEYDYITYDNTRGILIFGNAGPVVTGDTTLDRIYTASGEYLEGAHGVTALSTSETDKNHSVYINGVKYYYNSDNEALVDLANTGNKALKVLDNSTGAVFSYYNGTTTVYYGYDAEKLPISAWEKTVGTELDYNYYVIDQNGDKTYYKIDLPKERIGQSKKIRWSDTASTGQTGSVAVTLPNNQT